VGWLIDVLVGGIVGAIVGAIVAVNFVILVGVDQGYQASLGEVFDRSVAAGVVTLLVLIAGPVLGVAIARRQRRRRSPPLHEPPPNGQPL
jgi:uncharacterized membrane protein